MQPIQHVTIFGAGAMGAVYASLFFEMNPACVSFMAKGERAERLRTQGIIVNEKHYAIPVVTPEDLSPPSDLIIVALKHHRLQEALPDLKYRVGDDTIFLSVMNGLDSEAMIGAMYGSEKVLYAIAVGIDALREDSKVVYTNQGKIFFGEAENPTLTERVKRVQDFFERAGIIYETPQDMIRLLWWKFMINVGVNQSSAVLRAPFGVFQKSEDARALMETAMREVVELAQAANVNLVEEDIRNWYNFLFTLSPNGKTSMLQDLEAGRKTEVEIFGGKVVELSKTYSIPTPVNQTLLRIIKVLESSYR
ncbi:2-dehydropantoate 2-reductase [Candidatus Vecturithrix granuli]|uniref:2-dehydropantoate 2-reductase n=1 Tax=Vecturithrix granuli TaxID=1499967 RepID=A0A081C0U3_VECG1|nr:2-dehydropantoate 2-reductase [Candidatus Vecturithrix granuli]